MTFDEHNAEINRLHQESNRRNFESGSHDEFPGPCKGICKNYRAIKPLFTGRYAANQVRCQICEIFLTSEGTELKNGSPYCRCCHYKVRTKPRNSFYKEKFHEHVSVNKKQAPNKIESEQNQISQELTHEKKSTPIYYKKKNFGKTFYELKEFIEDGIIAHANYQYVMLKYLISHNGSHKGKIAESLAYYNNKDPSNIDEVKKYLEVPVFDVLEKTGFVFKTIQVFNKEEIVKYYIDVEIKEFQLIELDSILEKKIDEWNKEHGISIYEGEYEYGEIDWYGKGNLVKEKISTTMANDEKTTQNIPSYQVRNLQNEVDESEIIVKECQKCHFKVSGKPSEELVNRIQEVFGNSYMGCNATLLCRRCKIAENTYLKGDSAIESISLFDAQEDGIILKVFALKHSETIRKGQIIMNEQLVSKFRIENSGGIRYSAKNNLIVLCDTESGHYQNIMATEFQKIYFTGEEQSGDQTLSGGNKRIANSENVQIFYFVEVPKPLERKRAPLDNIYAYVGKVRYIKHVTSREKDIDGNSRYVIKFQLEIEK